MFKKAVKFEAKGRVGLVGPAGAGKSYTMLTLARQLAGPEGKIAAIDTEHGSLSKYADMFDFDVVELDSFGPDKFAYALKAAAKAGYSVFCCDSLSHFWVGKDGALEFVDERNRKHKDQMGGWKDWRPHEREMVELMITAPMHIICTMRTKTAYEDQQGSDGKKKRVKIGLAPVQREGLEYEFDLVGYMDDENTLIVDKTRCPFYAGKAISKPGAKAFEPFVEWLKGAAREPAPEKPAETTAPRPAAQPEPLEQPRQTTKPASTVARILESIDPANPWKVRSQMAAVFGKLKAVFLERGVDLEYARFLDDAGVKDPTEFTESLKARACFDAMWAYLNKPTEGQQAA